MHRRLWTRQNYQRKEVLKMKNDAISKQEVIRELDRRIELIDRHRFDEIEVTGNQYEELNQVLKKIIGVPLSEELSDVKKYVETL